MTRWLTYVFGLLAVSALGIAPELKLSSSSSCQPLVPRLVFTHANPSKTAINAGFFGPRYLNSDAGRFWTRDTFEWELYDPFSLHKYTYCENNSVNGLDPSGHLSVAEVVAYTTIATLIWAPQTEIHILKYFVVTDRERKEAISQNQIAIASLQKIIDSQGETTFDSEHLGVGGLMGVRVDSTSYGYSACVNLFENGFNYEGWPSAVEEKLGRISLDSWTAVPGDFSVGGGTKAVELAKYFLNRNLAFDAWLRRDY